MTKSETREITKLIAWHAANVPADIVARSMSALYRAARTSKSQNEILAIAVAYRLVSHPEFII